MPGFWPTGIQTEAKTKWCFVLFLHVREWWWSEPYLEHGEMHWAILNLSVSRPHRSEGPTWIFLGDYFGFLFDVSFDFWIFWHSSNRLEMHGMNGRVPRLFVFFVLRRTVRKTIFLVAFKVFCVFFHRWSRGKNTSQSSKMSSIWRFGRKLGNNPGIFGQNINTFI